MTIEALGAFESTFLPAHDVDVLELSGHVQRIEADLDLLGACGIRRLRYPVRWHRVEARRGRYDWAATDVTLGLLHERGLSPIVDLVHHTSYPRWLRRGFADRRFGDAYLRFCVAFAERYPWVTEYTLFNEPFATLFLAGHEGIWPPHGRGLTDFVRIVGNVLPALASASRAVGELLPDARHVYVDTCEAHGAADDAHRPHAERCNDRRFLLLDLLLGRPIDPARPFVDEVARVDGGARLLTMDPGRVDVLGLDYYAHSEWWYSEQAPRVPSPEPVGLASLAVTYHDRYGLPMLLSETNLRGTPADRATWLKHTLDQCERARAAGVPLEAYCWFPFIDSLDWDSLLARADGHIDPVGVVSLGPDLERVETAMTAAYAQVAAGARADDLPAYELSAGAADWLRALLPLMSHFDWRPAPEADSHPHDRRGRGITRRPPVEARP